MDQTRRRFADSTKLRLQKTRPYSNGLDYSGYLQGLIIILPSASGETTPPISPASRNFASTDLIKLRKNSYGEDVNVRTSTTSSRRTSYCPLPAHLVDPSFRLSTLQPPPELEAFSNDPIRTRRKTSLTDPNEPFLRLQIAQQAPLPRSAMNSPPITPTSPPPWATHSRSSTRRSSLANAALLPKPAYPHARTDSVALSEYSTLCPIQTTLTTKLENTISAWDDWDSDNEDGDRAGLASWMGRRKTKGRGSERPREGKGSMDSTESDNDATRPSLCLRETPKKVKKSMNISKEDQGLERARIEAAENARARRRDAEQKLAKKKPSGFIRAITCGKSDTDD
ncbi:hypothetical protein J4E91_000110 [Alternaria rosae]|nr:hypothetical protein J4E91_000110 [Alternaria rosae]